MKLLKRSFAVVALCVMACMQPNKGRVNEAVISKLDFGRLNKNAPPETEQYGQLVGEWECLVTSYRNDTIFAQSVANWIFTYALNGYAIQDYWRNPTKLDSTNQRQILGTNIRIYNPQLRLWQCAWMANRPNSISGIWLSEVNDVGEILLYDESKTWQIKFYNITDRAFDWKWDVEQPDGAMGTSVTIEAKKVSVAAQ